MFSKSIRHLESGPQTRDVQCRNDTVMISLENSQGVATEIVDPNTIIISSNPEDVLEVQSSYPLVENTSNTINMESDAGYNDVNVQIIPPKQFQMKAPDGRQYIITLTGIQEMISENGEVESLSFIRVETEGREPETITVSGMNNECNLESMAQVAEIIINSYNSNQESEISSGETTSVIDQRTDVNAYQTVGLESQYVAMQEESCVSIQVQPKEIPPISEYSSQNLVSLAQIAELVINHEGSNPNIHDLEISTDSHNQPIVTSDMSRKDRRALADLRGRLATRRQYVTLPIPKPVKVAPSNYTVSVGPDSRPERQRIPRRNIYNKIDADGKDCYMVLPDRMQKILHGYDPSMDIDKPKIKPDPDKPQTFSVCCQTTGGLMKSTRGSLNNDFYNLAVRKDLHSTISRKEFDAKDPCNFAIKNAHNSAVSKVRTGPNSKYLHREPDDLPDNCGYEVSVTMNRNCPKVTSETISVQTDVTVANYISVTPDEFSQLDIKRPIKRRRRIYTSKRTTYLDDTSNCKSPYLVRKSNVDPKNAFYICGTCNESFLTSDGIRKHSKDHKTEALSCTACTKKYVNIRHLTEHLRLHKKNTFPCKTCPDLKAFTTPESYTGHIKQHRTVKSFYLCGCCKLKFNHIIQLEVHLRIHTGEKPYKCSQCPIKFSQKVSMECHFASCHLKKKPHVCDSCGISMSRRTDLRIHMRSHTGERPYKCEFCDLAFASNSGLTSHKKTHFRARFHKCRHPKCNKSFDSPARAKQHFDQWHAMKWIIRNGSQIKGDDYEDVLFHPKFLFPCLACDFGTDEKVMLCTHIKKMHPILVKKMPELFESCIENANNDDSLPEPEDEDEGKQAEGSNKETPEAVTG